MSRKQSSANFVTSIEDYVRAKYQDFAALLDYCRLFHLATPRPGTAGVTFIIPTNKKYIESIRELSLSTNAADVGKACDSLLALITRKAMKGPSDWAEVADSRFPSQLISGKPSRDGGVELAHNGKVYAKLTIDPEFKAAFRENISVWLLTEGHMREEMDAEAPRKPRQSSRARGSQPRDRAREGGFVSGGYDATEAHIRSTRFKIGVAAENEFVVQHSTGAGARSPCSFLIYTVSFARFMHAKHPHEFFQRVLPLVHCRTTDFYTLFEPHRVAQPSDYLIESEFIDEWWATFTPTPVNMQQFREWLTARLTAPDSSKPECAIYPGPSDDPCKLIMQIDAIREHVSKSLQNPAEITRAIHAAYSDLCATNQVGESSNVFPDELIKFYRAHKHFKEMHDELAFVIEPLIIKVCRSFDLKEFQIIINIIGNVMHANNEAELANKLPLVSPAKVNMQIIGGMQSPLIGRIRQFVNSTIFFWVPLTCNQRAEYPIESDLRPSEGGDTIFNADQALALHHARIFDSSSGDKFVLSVLSGISQEHMSADVRAKIAALAGK